MANYFTVTPANASAIAGQEITFTVTLLPGPGGYQVFTLSDGGSGGVFSPSGLTVSAASGTAYGTFQYTNSTPGSYTISVAPSGTGSEFGVAPVTCDVNFSAGSGSGISTGRAGGNMAGAVQNIAGATFAKGFLFGNNPASGINNDVPFGYLQNFSLKNTLGLKELMGPEGVVALAAGASERKIVIDAQFAKINPVAYGLMMGGTLVTVSAVASPATAVAATIGAAATSGYLTGYVAVAYDYQTQYGETLICPLTAVQVTTAGQALNVASIGSLPTGVLSANLFANAIAYSTSALAVAAPLYIVQNYAGGATTILAQPSTTARQNLTASNIVNGSRVYTSSILDEPTAFSLQFQTPFQGGIDQDIKIYGLIVPDFNMDFKNKEFVIPKFTANCYGDPTQTGTVLMTIRQI